MFYWWDSMEINEDNLVKKEVKEYSSRLRVNLNKSDGFVDGDGVTVIVTEVLEEWLQEYEDTIAEKQSTINGLMMQIDLLKKDIDKLKIENDLLNNQQNNLKNIIDDIVNPIYEKHQKELSDKDVTIKQLQMENNALKHKSSQFCIDIMDLSALQFIFTDKKKVLIDDFNKSISLVLPNDAIADTDVKRIEDVKSDDDGK